MKHIVVILFAASIAAFAQPSTELLWPQGAPGALGDDEKDKPSLTSYLANPAKADPWLLGLLARMPFRQAAIALANKTARIIWALLARGGAYVARHQPVVQVASA